MLFIFYCNNSTSFETLFYMETIKSRLFIKHLWKRKWRARFCLSLGWLHISEQKLLETAILLQELKKYKKWLVSDPALTLIVPIFRERKKGKLYILKKVGLSTFKEMLLKYEYNSTVMFFNIFLFCLTGYSQTLKLTYSKLRVLKSWSLRQFLESPNSRIYHWIFKLVVAI